MDNLQKPVCNGMILTDEFVERKNEKKKMEMLVKLMRM